MPGHDESEFTASRIGTIAKIPSSFLLTGCLPVSSSAHLPGFSMRSRKMQQSLACNARAAAINSAAT
jgi:hypothetical protein